MFRGSYKSHTALNSTMSACTHHTIFPLGHKTISEDIRLRIFVELELTAVAMYV